MEIYIGGVIASWLGLFSMHIVLLNKFKDEAGKWDAGDYLLFFLLIAGCLFWPVTIPYAIKQLTQQL